MQPLIHPFVAAAAVAMLAAPAQADTITDWNTKVGQILADAKLGTPPAVRAMALVQTATLGAVEASPRDASVEAAVAAANRTALIALVPSQKDAIEQAYQAALAAVTDAAAKAAGVAAGERAAAATLAARAGDMPAGPEAYRPHAVAGAYVPTAPVAVPTWSGRRPWLMASASQFRPAPPPALTSDTWARDYNEIKALGGRSGSGRSAEQTEAAKFWDYSLPPIYTNVVRSVALAPGRDVLRNARLYAAATQAMDDAMISVFDAKYAYNFWRPVTAIRNADNDGHDGTARDASWAPLVDNPMHPEYPSGHSILASSVGAVIKADVGAGPLLVLATTSPTAPGITRRWNNVDDFVREVSDARIWGGLHFRFTTEVSNVMGRKIGELAAGKVLAPQH
ncbi:MAG: vanadium-dependent haloperoxidase [Rhodospirillaceae bacterium]|nr:vanadium-dependent haloperoxidase [Rhodospirillaceae bacterium]